MDDGSFSDFFAEKCGISIYSKKIGAGAEPEPLPSEALEYYSPFIAKMAPKRREEFLGARYCLAKAIAQAGYLERPHWAEWNPGAPPELPKGYVGSISHCRGLAIAAVARADRWSLLGVDCERFVDSDRAEKIAPAIMDDFERRILDASDVDWPQGFSLLFSAKESLYKALYPRVKRHMGFSSAHLVSIEKRPEASESRVTLKLTSPQWGELDARALEVHFQLKQDHVVTLAAIAPDQN